MQPKRKTSTPEQADSTAPAEPSVPPRRRLLAIVLARYIANANRLREKIRRILIRPKGKKSLNLPD